MSGTDHDQGDRESLGRKLRAFESQLSAGERAVLRGMLAGAALSGVVLGAAEAGPAGAAVPVAGPAGPAVAAGSAGEVAARAAEDLSSLRAQFAAAFTPGGSWDMPTDVSIKPPR